MEPRATGPELTRRLALAWGSAGLLTAATTGCDRATGSNSTTGITAGPPTGAPGTPQPLPPQVQLSPHVADVHLRLRASPGTARIVGTAASAVLSYTAEVLSGDPATIQGSGSYLGPTIHLRTGQHVKVTFDNGLDQASIVHWHGLHLPQEQDGQPAYAVDGGSTYEYDFTVTADPGTYWYHPHPHMHTGEQVYRGLAGLLIVHGDEPAALADLPEFSLVLQDRRIDASGALQYVRQRRDQMMGFVGETLVTNGVADLVLAVEPRAYRVRILNGANARTSWLTRSDGGDVVVVATDGHLLPRAVATPGVLMTPAQRLDVWLDFSELAAGDRLQLRSADTFVESGGMGGMGGGQAAAGSPLDLRGQAAVTFVVGSGARTSGTAPSTLATGTAATGADLAGRAVNAAMPKDVVLSTRQMNHWINDRQWQGREVTAAETVRAGSVELWRFVSNSPMPHPMHLHGLPFKVVERSWNDDTLRATWEQLASGVIESGLRDTVMVFPGQNVTIAVPFGDFHGYFLYHCHILEHEDTGMMRNFLITE